ncbi:DNA repair protein RecN [Macrococcus equipercicus]|uniref:DNA repair protein RecN n=1 Tax=Macrococcus equipercicus TaxID=69967 RepID=A0A9Q9BP93_9STAP|nr:DNA repair protein RecN [Macrococcus equipercicus]KAA1040133.1 DNA repair protein RecN [Macrococcus equipercicus]UTH12919.1 DNA repair protein RecN [Macrococcus equipercicus]
MLQTLSIRQFAIIEQLEIELKQGLTVLSGETGAGKSIIIDAISQLIGARASQNLVRHGENKAVVEGVFDIDHNPVVQQMLDAKGIDRDDFMLVKREIMKSGKSICRINNQTVTLNELRTIMQELLDIHGQHETQHLLKPKYHLSLLDEYSKGRYAAVKQQYQTIYGKYRKKQDELKRLERQDDSLLQRLDLIKFQHHELSQAKLVTGEKTVMTEDINRLRNFEKLNIELTKAVGCLSNEDNILDKLFDFTESLKEVDDILSGQYTQLVEETQNTYYLLEDAKHRLHDEMTGNDYDEQTLNELEERMNLIQQLERKYGVDHDGLIHLIGRLETEINQIENLEESTSHLKEEIDALYEQLLSAGSILSKERRKDAHQLRNDILQEIHHLEMKSANIELAFTKTEPSMDGLEVMEFMISPNKGEPLKSLYKIASGGELSRIMLALKSIFAENKGQTAILFDEVDTGVSGRVAQKMAEKMKAIAKHMQVICISHLPQVAAISDHHLYIEKHERDERTVTSVTELTGAAKVNEVARMISGVEVTPLTLEHAAELIAQNKKE